MPSGRDWDDEPEYDIDPDYDDYDDEYDYEDEGTSSRRRSLMVLSVLLLLIVFGGVVFVAYQQGMKQGNQAQPPVLQAENMPGKVAPKEPGGVKIPHQENTIYDRIDGSSKDNEELKVEQLLPPAEEPVDLPEKKTEKPSAPSQETSEPGQEKASSEASEQPAQTPAAPKNVTVPEPEPAPVRQEDQAVEKVKAALAETSPPAPSRQAGSGGYVVQLAAFRDEDAARTAFRKLQGKHASLLGGLSADIQRADLGDKGIYYRLRAGYMGKTDAAELCAKLKAQGQGCLVRPR
ncbi:SPOR domain-containing protein [uncultured Parvibaculum sp.]|uniref:SPOR domain-containing protein n=1 Tax=uncultured Parvibaculum sp. TaxID=291828 RepID=UPI0030D6CFC2